MKYHKLKIFSFSMQIPRIHPDPFIFIILSNLYLLILIIEILFSPGINNKSLFIIINHSDSLFNLLILFIDNIFFL